MELRLLREGYVMSEEWQCSECGDVSGVVKGVTLDGLFKHGLGCGGVLTVWNGARVLWKDGVGVSSGNVIYVDFGGRKAEN